MRIETKAKLDYLKGTKSAIADALVEKGQTVSSTDTFRSYADKVRAIKSGGGGLEPGVYYKRYETYYNKSNPQTFIWYNNNLYVFTYSGSYLFDVIRNDGYRKWTTIVSGYQMKSVNMSHTVFLNGKIHFAVGGKYHYVFDGETITQLNDIPTENNIKSAVLYNGTIYAVDRYRLYAWEESTDTWTEMAYYANTYDDAWRLLVSHGELFGICGKNTLLYSNGSFTKQGACESFPNWVHNGFGYGGDGFYNIVKYDPYTGTSKTVGTKIRFTTTYECSSDTPTPNKFLVVGDTGKFFDCVEVIISEDES